MESMTGYGTAEGKVAKGRLFVEIKSINHRFSEINIKIPARMGVLEAFIRRHLSAQFVRGKIDVFFKEKEPLFGGVSIAIDLDLARQYQRMLGRLQKELGIGARADFLQAVGLERILRVEEREGSYERLWAQIVRLLDAAAKQVKSMRLKEGAHIRRDQRERLAKVRRIVQHVSGQSDRALDKHLHRLRRKVSNAGGSVDEQRLSAEVAYLGGRQDIAEELLRLESHVRQYTELMELKEPVGRKLDFLLQEMGREVNTIGSKAADARISQLIVDAKSELERLREQIQNIE